MIYLKRFVLELAEDKEIKMLSVHKERVRDIEREMEKAKIAKEPIEVEEIVGKLAKIESLKKNFTGGDWQAVRKEISQMR